MCEELDIDDTNPELDSKFTGTCLCSTYLFQVWYEVLFQKFLYRLARTKTNNTHLVYTLEPRAYLVQQAEMFEHKIIRFCWLSKGNTCVIF